MHQNIGSGGCDTQPMHLMMLNVLPLQVAVGCADGSVALVDLVSDTVTARLESHAADVQSLSWVLLPTAAAHRAKLQPKGQLQLAQQEALDGRAALADAASSCEPPIPLDEVAVPPPPSSPSPADTTASQDILDFEHEGKQRAKSLQQPPDVSGQNGHLECQTGGGHQPCSPQPPEPDTAMEEGVTAITSALHPADGDAASGLRRSSHWDLLVSGGKDSRLHVWDGRWVGRLSPACVFPEPLHGPRLPS